MKRGREREREVKRQRVDDGAAFQAKTFLDIFNSNLRTLFLIPFFALAHDMQMRWNFKRYANEEGINK